MPTFTRGAIAIHYEVHGAGHPVLLFAPGGMRSSAQFWDLAPFDPVHELVDRFRVIAMDQRNAGRSRAPVAASDGWGTYAEDHVALLDHLGVERCHLLGACIGGSFALRLIAAAPARVTAAVLQQPIGLSLSGENRVAFHQLFDSWAKELVASRADVMPAALAGFRANLYGGDFVFSVSRDEVRRCAAPLLVLRGNDVYHPAETSEEIVRLAPRADLVPSWKVGDDLARAVARVKAFLAAHEPPAAA
jgi:pimeloyl-ACP methyl ester carboxylesterase